MSLKLNQKIKITRRWLYVLIFVIFGLLSVGGYLIFHPYDFHMIDRKEWGAVEPLNKFFLSLPVQNVLIHEHPFECDTKETCISYLRELQHNRTKLKDDIDSNFLIGGDGQIYEGTGWHINPFPEENGTHIIICVFDRFDRKLNLSQKVDGIQRLMAEGVRLGNLSPDYHVFSRHTPYNMYKEYLPKNITLGSKLYDLMQKWPRFSSDLGLLYPNEKRT